MSWLAAVAYAQQGYEQIPLLENIKREIVDPIIWLLAAVAFIYFLYGVYEMIAHADSEEARKTGQQHVLWGVIGLFIMFSVIGILNLICTTIGCK